MKRRMVETSSCPTVRRRVCHDCLQPVGTIFACPYAEDVPVGSFWLLLVGENFEGDRDR
ncbi:hypothetical protein PGTUg99_013497 [Puccinia graminis f. sp. tritici]|uniref:Uncharacterized protein n=1 Tax=Puccinia graminis f. sp. tritici TaxID=56615 RepID=A0A5B0N9Z1_PUCGR|nr:hypothetical protein PGTUg99_013497 [Puccinia graminis f. sp. tritici]